MAVVALHTCCRGLQRTVAEGALPPCLAVRPRNFRAERTHVATQVGHRDRLQIKAFADTPPQMIDQVICVGALSVRTVEPLEEAIRLDVHCAVWPDDGERSPPTATVQCLHTKIVDYRPRQPDNLPSADISEQLIGQHCTGGRQHSRCTPIDGDVSVLSYLSDTSGSA